MSFFLELTDKQSSLISEIEYLEDLRELRIKFKKYYVEELIYFNVPQAYFEELATSKSFGKCYLQLIKPNFSTKTKNSHMADKILKCKIDVTKIPKEHLFTGEKGVYANFTILYKEEKDSYGNNGVIVMDVPTEIFKDEKARNVPKDKQTRGSILGNCSDWTNKERGNSEGAVGSTAGLKAGVTDGVADDLPF